MIGRGHNLLLNSYQYSTTNPLYLQNGQYIQSSSISFISNRDMLVDQTNNKYAEKIEFSNNGTNFATVIGYNPAVCVPNSIDKTNYLISSMLNNNYKGYYLFNMFPDVTPQKIRKSNSVFPNYIDEVLNFLITDSNICMDDIFIFWGSSVYVSVSVENKLIKLHSLNRNLYTIGTTVTSHQHPGRNVSLQTIAFHNANLSSIVPNFRYLK